MVNVFHKKKVKNNNAYNNKRITSQTYSLYRHKCSTCGKYIGSDINKILVIKE